MKRRQEGLRTLRNGGGCMRVRNAECSRICHVRAEQKEGRACLPAEKLGENGLGTPCMRQRSPFVSRLIVRPTAAPPSPGRNCLFFLEWKLGPFCYAYVRSVSCDLLLLFSFCLVRSVCGNRRFAASSAAKVESSEIGGSPT